MVGNIPSSSTYILANFVETSLAEHALVGIHIGGFVPSAVGYVGDFQKIFKLIDKV